MKNRILFFTVIILLNSLNIFCQVSIHDIQYTTDPYGDSPYMDDTVTVTGIVTASPQDYDLGYVYIQDEGGGQWSGIMLAGSSDIYNLYRGEEITVFGVVRESFGMTYIDVSSATLTGHLKDISISDLDPSDSAAYVNNGWEKWESVLVRYKDPGGNQLYISHPKVDQFNDFGDYAVSIATEKITKKLGVILAGRQSSSNQSSLWVSIVSDSAWINNSGQMQVPAVITSTSMQMDAVIGIMSYGFGSYRLLPRNNDDFVNINIELQPTNLPGSPLAINENNKENFEIYPNPCADFINISFDSNEKTELNIFDLTGKQVNYQQLIESPHRIVISDLVPGAYIIQLKGDETYYNAIRFIKQY